MSGRKVHYERISPHLGRRIPWETVCGTYVADDDQVTEDWDHVTCKRCLAAAKMKTTNGR